MDELKQPEVADWTAKNGLSNSSDEFLLYSAVVASLIRSSAHDLVNGRTERVGRLIMAQLAHVHGLQPRSPDGSVNS